MRLSLKFCKLFSGNSVGSFDAPTVAGLSTRSVSSNNIVEFSIKVQLITFHRLMMELANLYHLHLWNH